MAKNRKDLSVLIDKQLPEFTETEYPKFNKFLKKYYEFLESQEIHFSGVALDEFKPTTEADEYIQFEDDTEFLYSNSAAFTKTSGVTYRLALESVRDFDANVSVQFVIGETITGNSSKATAEVTGTTSNHHAWIRPTNNGTFTYGETITGSTNRVAATLANGSAAGMWSNTAIETFRSRGPVAAVNELKDFQDIDKTPIELIDKGWKPEFYANLPRNTLTNRRILLRHMKDFYRAKGNESAFQFLFRALYQKENITFYYPKEDMIKLSDGRWTIDKSVKINSDTATNITMFTGRKITGQTSNATAIVERQVSSAVGILTVTELFLSTIENGIDENGVVGTFRVNEEIRSTANTSGDYAVANTVGVVASVEVVSGGTNYVVGDEISISGGGGDDARARVAAVADAVIEDISVLDSGDGFTVGDVVTFVNEGTGGTGGAAQVGEIYQTGTIDVANTIINDIKDEQVQAADYGSNFSGHAKTTHMFSNTSTTFYVNIDTGKTNNGAGINNGQILMGDHIAKQVTNSTGTITQTGNVVTFTTAFTDEQRRDMVGGMLIYEGGSSSNTAIISGFNSNTDFTVNTEFTISGATAFTLIYKSSNTFGTVIGGNTSTILYALGSYTHDSDLGTFSSTNFINNDSVILYNTVYTESRATLNANGSDADLSHTSITFDINGTPASVNTAVTNTIANSSGGESDVAHITGGAFNMTSFAFGAIKSLSITSSGSGYESSPVVSAANSYIAAFNNALDVTGPNTVLLNVNTHTYTTGTLTQDGNTVTLSGGSFPEANDGFLKIAYANGQEDFVTSITNTTTISVDTTRIIQSGEAQTYTATYGSIANTFSPGTYLYNDGGNFITEDGYGSVVLETTTGAGKLMWDYYGHGATGGAQAQVLDFIDKAKSKPTIALGNTSLRVSMETANDFIDGQYVTGYAESNSTYDTGTITQTGSSNTVTLAGSGASWPYGIEQGTLTYSGTSTGNSTVNSTTTATIISRSNSSSIDVDTGNSTLVIAGGNTFSVSYKEASVVGEQRTVTVAGANQFVTVTDVGHNLSSGQKITLSGATPGNYNGVYDITVINTNSYSYLMSENPSDNTATGTILVKTIVTANLATSNSFTVDSSQKGNNATLEIASIAIGAIQSVTVYNFGAGYTSAPAVDAGTGNKNAALTAALGSVAEYAGYYAGTKGLISSVPKMQDNKYYQDFSYVLKTDFDVNDYRGIMKTMTHPAGMALFGEVAIKGNTAVRLFANGDSGNINSLQANSLMTANTATVPRYYTNFVEIGNWTNASNSQIVSTTSAAEMEIYTADADPWIISGKIELDDNIELLLEDARTVTVARANTTHALVTDNVHGLSTSDTISIERAGNFSTLLETEYNLLMEYDTYHFELEAEFTTDYILEEDGGFILHEDDPVSQTPPVRYNVQMEAYSDGATRYAATTVADAYNGVFNITVLNANQYTYLFANSARGSDPSTNAVAQTVPGVSSDSLIASTFAVSNTFSANTANNHLRFEAYYSGERQAILFEDGDTLVTEADIVSSPEVMYFEGDDRVTQSGTSVTLTGGIWPTEVANNGSLTWIANGLTTLVASRTNSTVIVVSTSATVASNSDFMVSYDIGENFIQESGGTFLLPQLKFPTAETGTVSIDMGFSSTVLLESGVDGQQYYYIVAEDGGRVQLEGLVYILMENDDYLILEDGSAYLVGEEEGDGLEYLLPETDWIASSEAGILLMEDSDSNLHRAVSLEETEVPFIGHEMELNLDGTLQNIELEDYLEDVLVLENALEYITTEDEKYIDLENDTSDRELLSLEEQPIVGSAKLLDENAGDTPGTGVDGFLLQTYDPYGDILLEEARGSLSKLLDEDTVWPSSISFNEFTTAAIEFEFNALRYSGRVILEQDLMPMIFEDGDHVVQEDDTSGRILTEHDVRDVLDILQMEDGSYVHYDAHSTANSVVTSKRYLTQPAIELEPYAYKIALEDGTGYLYSEADVYERFIAQDGSTLTDEAGNQFIPAQTFDSAVTDIDYLRYDRFMGPDNDHLLSEPIKITVTSKIAESSHMDKIRFEDHEEGFIENEQHWSGRMGVEEGVANSNGVIQFEDGDKLYLEDYVDNATLLDRDPTGYILGETYSYGPSSDLTQWERLTGGVTIIDAGNFNILNEDDTQIMLESGHILQLEATENFMRMEDGSNITLETGYHLIEESSEINWSALEFVGSGTDFQNELQCNLVQDAGDGNDLGLFILESESEISFLKLELSSGTEIVIDKEILVQEESEFITLESTERIIDEETNCIYGHTASSSLGREEKINGGSFFTGNLLLDSTDGSTDAGDLIEFEDASGAGNILSEDSGAETQDWTNIIIENVFATMIQDGDTITAGSGYTGVASTPSYYILSEASDFGAHIVHEVFGANNGVILTESGSLGKLLFEDNTEMLETDAQEFIISSITNSTFLTATTQHVGGVEDARAWLQTAAV